MKALFILHWLFAYYLLASLPQCVKGYYGSTVFQNQLLVGSISLIGGVGQTMAWFPTFAEMGVEGAAKIGIASNALGLIFACLVWGPIATT
ncbi:sodium/glutamate symporter [Photobacterium sp. DNB22_13_2]